MLEESRKREIEIGIAQSFDKRAVQEMASFFEKMHNSHGEKAKEIYKKKWNEEALLAKRAFDRGFHRYVLNRVLGNKVLMRHRSKLIELSLISIASERGITSEEISDVIDRKKIQRFRHEQYPSFFTDVPNEIGRKHKDNRERRFSTVYSPWFHSDNPFIFDAADYLEWDKIRNLSNRETVEKLFLHASEPILVPEKWTDFKHFLQEFNDAIGRITASKSLSKEVLEYLRKELRSRFDILELFHGHLMSILSDEWFKTLSDKEGKDLLERQFPKRISKKDIEKTFQILTDIWGTKDNARFLLSHCAESLRLLGDIKDSITVLEGLVEYSDPDTETLGILTENIGIMYRENNEPEKARRYIENAVDLYRQSANAYREMIGLKNLGEMEIRIGMKRRGMALFKKIEERAIALNDMTIAQNVLWNLSVSSRRLNLIELEKNYLDACQEYEPTNSLLLLISDRILEMDKERFRDS